MGAYLTFFSCLFYFRLSNVRITHQDPMDIETAVLEALVGTRIMKKILKNKECYSQYVVKSTKSEIVWL